MVDTFKKLLNNVESVQKKVPEIVYSVAQDNSDELIDLNVEQLSKGLTNKGELIKPEYESESDDYAQLKKALGSKAPKGTPDLILEGDFTGDFFTQKKSNGILIDSSDSKANYLGGKYSNIYGLAHKSKEEFNQTIIPEALKIIENGITRGI